MTFRIELTKSAAKALKTIPKTDQKRIAERIESLAEASAPREWEKHKARCAHHTNSGQA